MDRPRETAPGSCQMTWTPRSRRARNRAPARRGRAESCHGRSRRAAFPVVNATKTRRDGAPHDAEAETLGHLLYAHAATSHASEQDWELLVRAIADGDQLALHALFE